nr:hypothetical protein [Anaeromyxobacter diazotrophicus]
MGVSAANEAVTALSAETVHVHAVPEVESQPLQPANVAFGSGAAVNVTTVPSAADTLHVAPQLIPLPLTVPVPDPVFWTVRVCVVGPLRTKDAVTVLPAVIVHVHVAPIVESHPLQPAKAEPPSGVAVSVTLAP